jgi:SAM-dependent methyltransferase
VDAIIRLTGASPGTAIFEVGAGTGKATVLLAERGLRILALEPDPAMAAIARANCTSHSDVEIVESDFERFPVPERRPAIISAQAWHWVDPETRYRKAHEALLPGGKLLAMWTAPDWESCALRQAFAEVYRATVPDMAADFPMHPASDPPSLAGDWHREIAGAEAFGDPAVESFPWRQRYTGAEYAGLLATHQDHILLADADQVAVLKGIDVAVARAGGAFTMSYVTRVCVATAAD